MRRLLAIDDNEDILKLIEAAAKKAGFVTRTLSSSLEFQEAFRDFEPDAIVLDVLMPRMDGIEIIQWLLEQGFTGRVIVMSGNADYIRMAVHIGSATDRLAVVALEKPFRATDLRNALEAGGS